MHLHGNRDEILSCDAEMIVLIPARQLLQPVSAMTERVVDLGDKEVEDPSAAISVGERVVAALIKGCNIDACLTHVSVNWL